MMRLLSCLLCCALAAHMPAAQARGQEVKPVAGGTASKDPFAPLSWQPPAPAAAPASATPAAPPPPAAPPAPSAPPLPFKYFGRYTADVPLVVLTAGERMIVAKAGDTIDGTWRIDRIGPALIEFTYLPLQLKRALATGDAG